MYHNTGNWQEFRRGHPGGWMKTRGCWKRYASQGSKYVVMCKFAYNIWGLITLIRNEYGGSVYDV